MLRRLAIFRENNTEDNTMLNFFNEIEIHPKIVDITQYRSDDIESPFKELTEIMGTPIAFAPSLEEEIEAIKIEDERKRLTEEQERLERELSEKRAAQEYYKKMEDWCKLLEDLQMEEERLLVAQSEPLRNYLMQFIFPTLCKGLVETARMKPEDPIDFLAEYLFRENPEGRMFDPSYTREGILIQEKREILMEEEQPDDDPLAFTKRTLDQCVKRMLDDVDKFLTFHGDMGEEMGGE